MVLDSTTESINIVLSGAVSSNQLQFYASYNTITSTSITPTKNQGTTNSAVPVSLVPPPSSGQQNQLRSCSVYNADVSPATVVITYSGSSGSAVVFSAAIDVDETIQYSFDNGWQVFNSSGQLKMLGMYEGPSALRFSPALKPANATTILTCASGTDYGQYIGRADRSLSTIKLAYRVVGSPSPITWAEAAIYRTKVSIASATTVTTLCGFADISGTIGSTGQKTTTIPVTGINQGDDLFVVFGSVHTGTYTLRGGLTDDIGAGNIGTATGSLRPSINNTLTFTTQTATTMVWIAWQPSQW